MQYSKQFIEEIIHHLNPKLESFFNQKKNITKFPVETFIQLIYKALDTNFKGFTNREDLVPTIAALKKLRYTKRSRWYNSYTNDIKVLDCNNPKYPLAPIVTLARTLPYDAYMEMFGDKSLDMIIEDELQKALDWKNNADSFFIEFPGLTMQTDTSIFNALLVDIALDAWKYINSELHGNINSYLMRYPDALADKPLFGPTAMTIMQNTGGNILKEIISDENNSPIMEISMSDNKLTKESLTPFDLKILNTVIANVDLNTFYKDKTVIMNMTTLAHSLVSYNPGMNIFNKIRNACQKLMNYNYTYVYGGTSLFFTLFDHIEVDMDKKQAMFTFGDLLTDAIIQQKLITITSPVYGVLKNNLSSIICYAMKKEQITNQETLIGEYSYIYFQKIVRFKSNNKRKNINLLKSSLQEFIANGIIIDSFKVNSVGLFTIKFLKLSDAELEDLGKEPANIVDI